MNLIIDALRNRICLSEEGTKKESGIAFSADFPFALKTAENQTKALTELLKNEEAKPLFSAKNVSLLLPDDGIGFGTFEVPALSKRKAQDVFDTRFKVSYPDFADYYVYSEEYERSSSGCLYFYTFAKKGPVEQVTSMLKSQNISVGSVGFFSAHIAGSSDAKNVYPKATLFMGKENAELIITKGATVLFAYDFGYGSSLLLDGETFLDSAYHPEHDRSSQFAGFAAENFANQVAFTDENIGKTDPTVGFSVSRPKELRIMKDEVLGNYKIKNNFRKFYSLVADILARYASAPWFLPLFEVELFAPESIAAGLEELGKAEGVHFKLCAEESWNAILERPVTEARLFKSAVKKERRKFDWRKFLTMEIGKKKA